jgi:hypothetical protein
MTLKLVAHTSMLFARRVRAGAAADSIAGRVTKGCYPVPNNVSAPRQEEGK